ncbi:hypothetical protein FisN_UnNu065 [Fistulifera solaris]|uniref:Uncharacterized protein n=1 Tax=Fistulifera solaris TaxID=1519565 RepID=A0A1Z5JPI3_FISSO|nr:hypothetical protein FisN_UnNu065 [Fistulifera solaris]|eukprot:GAX15914.1 hypothetical protein FisN_UnNu065 [Fistulifera solaris]
MKCTTQLGRLWLCFQVLMGLVTSRGFSLFARNTAASSKTEWNSHSCLSRAEAYEQLETFLQETDASATFQIQGWRWHTMSLARQAERLQQLALRRPHDTALIQRAVNHVVGFNMKALHQIETDLFFPWVRKQISAKNPVVGSAIHVILEELEELRQSVQILGSQMNQDATLVASSSDPAVLSIAECSAQVAQQTRSMLHLENTYLVPTIARLIPETDQKSFNNQVIRNLGIWDSRLHLVGMYEAISGDPVEMKLFEQIIPSLARKMIPRWKRLLYEPVAGDW